MAADGTFTMSRWTFATGPDYVYGIDLVGKSYLSPETAVAEVL